MLPAIKKIRTSSHELTQVQDNISNVLNIIRQLPILNHIEIKITLQANQPRTINHGLERVPSGWIITDKKGFADIYRISWDDRTLTLTSNTLVEIKILVY